MTNNTNKIQRTQRNPEREELMWAAQHIQSVDVLKLVLFVGRLDGAEDYKLVKAIADLLADAGSCHADSLKARAGSELMRYGRKRGLQLDDCGMVVMTTPEAGRRLMTAPRWGISVEFRKIKNTWSSWSAEGIEKLPNRFQFTTGRLRNAEADFRDMIAFYCLVESIKPAAVVAERAADDLDWMEG